MAELPESFGRFGAHARTVLLASQRYAEAMQEGLGSEHMLLALTVTPDSPAYSLLRKIPVTLDQLRLVLRLEGGKKKRSTTMAAEAKTVLERAAFQAARLGSPTIDTEHLLWAMTVVEQCTAYRLIEQLGVEPGNVRKTLERHFAEHGGRPGLAGHEIEILGVVGAAEHGFGDPREQRTEPEEHEHDEESGTPVLDEFTTDLTQLAEEGALDPLVGRSVELERLVHILGRKTKNNPVLVGEPGVGKTAIIEGLAARVIAGDVPHYLQGSRILSLELSALVAGTMYRGQFEDRIRRLITELKGEERTILFVDEIHTLIGAGGAEGTLDAANIVKPMLAKGSLRLIGATTTTEYQKYVERDAALERRLQPIIVSEPTLAETRAILAGIRPQYETFHGVKLPDEILDEAVRLADRHLHDRRFPDKAIDLIDEAAAALRATLPASQRTNRDELAELERELKVLTKQKEYELRAAHLERAAFLRDKENALKLELKQRREQSSVPTKRKAVPLTPAYLHAVMSRWTNVPVAQLKKDERERLLSLEATLRAKIIGQDRALVSLARAIRRAKSGVGHRTRPLGSFLLVGPTGVGKTETARVLAEEVFGSADALLKLDMSEFMERHQVSRLIGAPPGYVGHDDSSKLLEAVRRRPHQVLLFDEIEKAHPDVFNVLLQILEDGVLTDGKGRRIHFEHTLVLLTSNVGSELWQRAGSLGFSHASRAQAAWDAQLLEKIRAQFRPELLGRLDEVITYAPLSPESLSAILTLELDKFRTRLIADGTTLTVSAAARAHLEAKLVSMKDARAIRKLVEHEVGSVVGDAILQSPKRHTFCLEAQRGTLVVRTPRTKRTNDA
ncbi:MAG: ATP-dependent Clp protease ATP-binding subunit [Patescibacteria group bacterium]|jgi:ATP-dependent Clp protease ATP-binding subunit ClpC